MSNAYYDYNSRRFVLITQNAGNIELDPEDPEFIVFTPYGVDNKFWRQALIRSLGLLWLMRMWAMRDWARYSEIHGLPIKKAFVPTDASPQEKDDFFAAIKQLSSEAIIRLPRGANGELRFDIDLLESKADTYEGIEKFKDALDKAIDIDVLGQTITTDGGDKGSFAKAKVGQHTESMFTKFDGESMATFLRNGPVKWWAGWNFEGGEDRAPWARWQTDPPEDLDKKSESLLRVAQAATAFTTAGVPVDWATLAEDYNIPMLNGGSQIRPTVAGAIQGGDEEEAQPADEPAGPDDPGEFEPGQTPGITKAARLDRRRASRSRHLEGQLYVDDLADISVRRGAQLLSTDVRAIARVVADSSTPEELRRRLKLAFKSTSPEDFAQLMGRALKMAHLAGRYSARR